MQRIDARVIQTYGIPRLLLMEHAGLALARHAQQLYQTRLGAPRRHHPIVICCGAGYNGGDGMAAARHLLARGFAVRVLLAARAARLREEPAVYAAILSRLGARPQEAPAAGASAWALKRLRPAGVVIDALLGIGMRGTVREPVVSLIAAMNRSGRPIVAADVPSGLDGDTGLPQGHAVRAALTVTFGAAKRGCLAARARPYVGRLVVEPITIPAQAMERA